LTVGGFSVASFEMTGAGITGVAKNGDDDILVEGDFSVSYTRYFDEKTMYKTEPKYHKYFL
jgi:hypothetical protein